MSIFERLESEVRRQGRSPGPITPPRPAGGFSI